MKRIFEKPGLFLLRESGVKILGNKRQLEQKRGCIMKKQMLHCPFSVDYESGLQGEFILDLV